MSCEQSWVLGGNLLSINTQKLEIRSTNGENIFVKGYPENAVVRSAVGDQEKVYLATDQGLFYFWFHSIESTLAVTKISEEPFSKVHIKDGILYSLNDHSDFFVCVGDVIFNVKFISGVTSLVFESDNFTFVKDDKETVCSYFPRPFGFLETLNNIEKRPEPRNQTIVQSSLSNFDRRQIAYKLEDGSYLFPRCE